MTGNHNNALLLIALFIVVSTTASTTVLAQQEENNKKQIILNPNNIEELKAFGETDKPWYPENYPPEYLFDNLINSYSFWTQQGNSGFNLILKENLDQSICNIELGVLQPQNTPFSLAINDKITNNNGTLSGETVQVNIGSNKNDDCIPNVNKISMNFTPADRLFWTTLSEIKLFSDTKPEPPPVVLPGNVTKFIITNSTVTIDLENSEVVLKEDANKQQQPEAAAAAAAAKQPTTPIGTPLPAAEEKEEEKEPKEDNENENEEEEEEEEEEKEKDNKN